MCEIAEHCTHEIVWWLWNVCNYCVSSGWYEAISYRLLLWI